MTRTTRIITLLAALLASTSLALAQQATDEIDPEGAAGAAGAALEMAAREPVTAEAWMVAAANPLASEAGAEILRQGGNAADALVAVQAVLGLVEPQSSGLGGGAFLVYYDAASGELTTFDGRETAPEAATPLLFLDEAGEPLEFFNAVVGGRSVGVPGTPRLLETVHARYGSKPWPDLLQAATNLADNGFEVSERLATLIKGDQERLSRFPATRKYFFDTDGEPLTAGAKLTNKAYAETLRALAKGGADAFYTGKIAESIVTAVLNAEGNPGVMSMEDLADYEVVERAPVCIEYRARDVCGMGPPSSGALTVGQILGIVENFDLKALGPDNPEAWRIIGEASRLGFADRGRYMADSDYVPMPTEGLLDKAYLGERAKLIGDEGVLEEVEAGDPEWSHASLWGADASLELPSTSHFSIVDADGNVVSITTTIENGFGSRLMASGFLLNNELTDFSFATHEDGRPIANRVEPGKRPRSSMSPTIVMRDDRPVLAIGSPGGSRIIPYVANALIAWIDWDMDVQAAIDLPHLVNRFGTYDLEEGTSATSFEPALQAMGFETEVRKLNSGLHAIAIAEDGTLKGGADPRREGVAIGE